MNLQSFTLNSTTILNGWMPFVVMTKGIIPNLILRHALTDSLGGNAPFISDL